VSPHYLAEIAKLHPAQQAAFQELMIWGNSGVEQGFTPSDVAIESALRWAQQVPIPPPAPELPEEETPEEQEE
jgi:hypothetical protein